MSLEITEAFVQQYGSALEHLVQQRGSRLRNRVTVMEGVVGTRVNFEQIGSTTAQSPSSRHADSPLISTPHQRRIIDMLDKEVGDLIDNDDQVRTLIDPTNAYTEAFGFALGRAIDTEIIRAADATANIGNTDGLTVTTEAFGGTTVAATGAATARGSESVALADLVAARNALRQVEAITGDEPLTLVCSSDTVTDMLLLSQVQSIDQNTYRALAGGEVTTFMGFDVVQTELVGNIGAANEKCYIFPRSAIRLGIGRDITHRISERPDKRFSTYVYSHMTIGATRTQSNNIAIIEVDHEL